MKLEVSVWKRGWHPANALIKELCLVVRGSPR